MAGAGRLAVAALLGLAVAGCDSLGPADGEAAVSISFARGAAAGGIGLAAARIPVTDGTHTVDLQRADVVFDEIVLEMDRTGQGADSDGDSEEDSDSDGPNNREFARGPVTVQLPLEGGIVTPFEEPVPAGAYEEIELDVAAVRLTGTFDGEAFDVTLPLDLEVEADFEPGLVVPEGETLNLTVTLDPLAWLRESDGSVIDPRRISSDAGLRNRLRQRIVLSLKAFEDSDRDADEADSDSDSR